MEKEPYNKKEVKHKFLDVFEIRESPQRKRRRTTPRRTCRTEVGVILLYKAEDETYPTKRVSDEKIDYRL